LSTYSLQRDIVIPAGTELTVGPDGSPQVAKAVIDIGTGAVAYLYIKVDAGILRKNPSSRLAERVMAAFQYARDNGMTLEDVDKAVKAAALKHTVPGGPGRWSVG